MIEDFGDNVQYIIKEVKVGQKDAADISIEDLKNKPQYTKENIREAINGETYSGARAILKGLQYSNQSETRPAVGELDSGRNASRQSENGRSDSGAETAADGLPGRSDGITSDNNPDVRFLLSEYSENERRDITLTLKPFVGSRIRLEDVEYQQYLAKLGIDVTESDAHTFAVMAMQENMRDIRKAAADKRDNYLYETFPLYREIVDIAGNGDFKIKQSSRFRGEEFSGSFISDAFVKFSQSKTKKNIASLRDST